jgi:hypothetical protein
MSQTRDVALRVTTLFGTPQPPLANVVQEECPNRNTRTAQEGAGSTSRTNGRPQSCPVVLGLYTNNMRTVHWFRDRQTAKAPTSKPFSASKYARARVSHQTPVQQTCESQVPARSVQHPSPPMSIAPTAVESTPADVTSSKSRRTCGSCTPNGGHFAAHQPTTSAIQLTVQMPSRPKQVPEHHRVQSVTGRLQKTCLCHVGGIPHFLHRNPRAKTMHRHP